MVHDKYFTINYEQPPKGEEKKLRMKFMNLIFRFSRYSSQGAKAAKEFHASKLRGRWMARAMREFFRIQLMLIYSLLFILHRSSQAFSLDFVGSF